MQIYSGKSCLMFCLDGLRRRDLSERYMPKMYKCLSENACMFTNAYSCSTSTYESLVPAYSGNDDLRTKYYEKTALTKRIVILSRQQKAGKNNSCIWGCISLYRRRGYKA